MEVGLLDCYQVNDMLGGKKKKVCRAQMASVHHHHHLNAEHSTLCTLDRIDSLLVLVFSQDLRTIIKTEL